MQFVLTLASLLCVLASASAQSGCISFSTSFLPPPCNEMGYDHIWMPNFVGGLQENPHARALEFANLSMLNCWPDLAKYVCLMYFPPCDADDSVAVMPCRELCEEARTSCQPSIREEGVTWPESLSCERLPSRTAGQLCRDSALQKPTRSSGSAASGSGSAPSGATHTESSASGGEAAAGCAVHVLEEAAAALVRYLTRAQSLMDVQQQYLELKQENLRLQNRQLRSLLNNDLDD